MSAITSNTHNFQLSTFEIEYLLLLLKEDAINDAKSKNSILRARKLEPREEILFQMCEEINASLQRLFTPKIQQQRMLPQFALQNKFSNENGK